MKKLVIYYSWSGKTRSLAQELAAKEGADLAEVKDIKKPGKLAAYTAGCFRALRMKRTPIEPLRADLAGYDQIVIMAPVWAGHPAPAVNNVFDLLPSGKEVEVVLVSMSGGGTARDKIEALVASKGCTLTACRDHKA